KRNEPAYIPLIGEKLASICKMTLEKIAEITTENARKLFKPG
ncbi:MAG: TatD family hydrolase, partial [Flavisolibacter sp.]